MLVGSEDLEAALCRAPCGCDLAARARRLDGADRVETQRRAAEAQAAWHCPFAGHAEPDPNGPLPDFDRDHAEALGCVERLADADDAPRTCPMFYTQQPWVHRVMRARQYRDLGQLEHVEPVPPAAVLVEAMAVVDAALAERRQREGERLRESIAERTREARGGRQDSLLE